MSDAKQQKADIAQDASGSGYSVAVRPAEAGLWSKLKPRLSRLDIELTERCNNNCLHCCINLPVDDSSAQGRELKTDELKDIIRQAADLGAMTVRFTGGEPLLRQDFSELYLFARRLGLRVMLFTNATLITPALADLLAQVPPLEKIEITVYGMSRRSYEAATRVPGSYAAFRRGVDLLLERRVPFIVKGALLPSNKDEVAEFEAWAATIPGMDKPPSYSMFFDLRNRREEDRNRVIKSVRLPPEEGLKFLTRDPEKYVKDMKEFGSKFMRPPGPRLFSCGAGTGGGCVDAYGRLQPCLSLRAPALTYDLKKGSLKEAIDDFFPRIREMEAKDPDYLARCARCFLKGLCEQCPAKSWTENGTLDTPVEYLCAAAHAQARWLGWLKEGERGWEVEDWASRLPAQVSK